MRKFIILQALFSDLLMHWQQLLASVEHFCLQLTNFCLQTIYHKYKKVGLQDSSSRLILTSSFLMGISSLIHRCTWWDQWTYWLPRILFKLMNSVKVRWEELQHITDEPLCEGLCWALGPGWCEVPSCVVDLQCWSVLVGQGRVFHAVPPLHHRARWPAPHSSWCIVHTPLLAWQTYIAY